MINAQLESSLPSTVGDESGKAVLWMARLAACALGAALFYWIYDPRIVDPRFIDWLRNGDLAQHFLGWDAFRREPWHWPLGKVESLNFPSGTTVVFTDSLPLFAIPLKLFHAVLPDPFQYIGLFVLLSYVLVGLTTHDLIHTLTRRPLLALLGTAMVLLLPPWHFRINDAPVAPETMVNHDTLMAFWVFIWAIRNSFRPWSRNAQAWFAANLFVTAAVHAYLLFIVLVFWGAWQLRVSVWPALRARDWRALRDGGIAAGAVLALMAVEMWALGYFTISGGGDWGFGYFSMNLNALFNPLFPRWSAFLPVSPLGTEGQYEGYMYLGLGLLLFALIALAARILVRPGEPAAQGSAWKWMTLPVAVLTLLALSNEIYLGGLHLLSLSYPFGLRAVGDIVRSSGRMFWPVAVLIAVWSLVVLAERLPPRKLGLLLLALLVVQFVDIRGGLSWEHRERPQRFATPEWREAFAAAERVRMIPKTRMAHKIVLSAAYLANRTATPINAMYLARWDRQHDLRLEREEIEALRAGEIEPRTLYFLSDEIPPLCLFPLAVRERIRTDGSYTFMLPEGAPLFGRPLPPIPGNFDVSQDHGLSLEELFAGCGQDCTLLVGVRDEAAHKLPDTLKEIVAGKGGTIDKLNYRDSYAAILHEGRVVAEAMSSDQPVTVAQRINGMDLRVMSAGKNAGNDLAISIDGALCSPAGRGLNITRIDWTTRSLGLYRYDTHRTPEPASVW